MIKEHSEIMSSVKEIISCFDKQRPIIFREELKTGTINKLRKVSKNPTIENLESLQKNTIVSISKIMIEKNRMSEDKLENFNSAVSNIVNYICDLNHSYSDLVSKRISTSQVSSVKSQKENGNYTIRTLHDLEIKIKSN